MEYLLIRKSNMIGEKWVGVLHKSKKNFTPYLQADGTFGNGLAEFDSPFRVVSAIRPSWAGLCVRPYYNSSFRPEYVVDCLNTCNYLNECGEKIRHIHPFNSAELAIAAVKRYYGKRLIVRDTGETIACHKGAGKSPAKRWGHPMFYELLDKMADLHSRKNHDYAGDKDPLKNLRSCKRINLTPFQAVIVRLQDKWSRLEEFTTCGELKVKDESIEDTLMDNAVYSLLAIILRREEKEKSRENEDKTEPFAG